MHTVAEIRVEALGGSQSMSEVVQSACEVLSDAELHYQTHDLGTNVEGEMHTVLAAIEAIHTRLHERGVSRLSTHVRLGTRAGIGAREGAVDLDLSNLPDAGQPPRLA